MALIERDRNTGRFQRVTPATVARRVTDARRSREALDALRDMFAKSDVRTLAYSTNTER